MADNEDYDIWVQSVFEFLLKEAEYPHEVKSTDDQRSVYFGSREAVQNAVMTWRMWYDDEMSVPQIRRKLNLSYRAVSARIEKLRNYLATVAVGDYGFDHIRDATRMLMSEYGYSEKDAMRTMFISSMVRTKTNSSGTFVVKSNITAEQMFKLWDGGDGLSMFEIGKIAGIDKSTVSRMVKKYRGELST